MIFFFFRIIRLCIILWEIFKKNSLASYSLDVKLVLLYFFFKKQRVLSTDNFFFFKYLSKISVKLSELPSSINIYSHNLKITVYLCEKKRNSLESLHVLICCLHLSNSVKVVSREYIFTLKKFEKKNNNKFTGKPNVESIRRYGKNKTKQINTLFALPKN